MEQSVKQAGAIVFRSSNNKTEVLLIYSKKRPQRVRIFPKGHIELGETSAEAAHRELIEEAGIKGEIEGVAGTIQQVWDEKHYKITYYIFKYLYNVSPGEDGREPAWFSPLEAYELLPSDNLRELFRTVVELRDRLKI